MTTFWVTVGQTHGIHNVLSALVPTSNTQKQPTREEFDQKVLYLGTPLVGKPQTKNMRFPAWEELPMVKTGGS